MARAISGCVGTIGENDRALGPGTNQGVLDPSAPGSNAGTPPGAPEPVSTRFSIRGACYGLSEPPDGSNLTSHTRGLAVPNCFQLVDLTNNRQALYTVAYPGRSVTGRRLAPSSFRRSPRTFTTRTPLPLSGLNCAVEYKTKVAWDDRRVVTRVSWLDLCLGDSEISVAMFIHIDGAEVDISGRMTVTHTAFGAFTFAKFGHAVFGD